MTNSDLITRVFIAILDILYRYLWNLLQGSAWLTKSYSNVVTYVRRYVSWIQRNINFLTSSMPLRASQLEMSESFSRLVVDINLNRIFYPHESYNIIIWVKLINLNVFLGSCNEKCIYFSLFSNATRCEYWIFVGTETKMHYIDKE